MSYTTPAHVITLTPPSSSVYNALADDVADLDSRTNPKSATVATSESTSAGTFGDLATLGPTVSIVTGTTAIVVMTASLSASVANGYAVMGFAVSGATLVGANTAQSLFYQAFGAGTGNQISAAYLATGLTPGTNVFTAKYYVSGGGTATFSARNLVVWPGNKLS